MKLIYKINLSTRLLSSFRVSEALVEDATHLAQTLANAMISFSFSFSLLIPFKR